LKLHCIVASFSTSCLRVHEYFVPEICSPFVDTVLYPRNVFIAQFIRVQQVTNFHHLCIIFLYLRIAAAYSFPLLNLKNGNVWTERSTAPKSYPNLLATYVWQHHESSFPCQEIVYFELFKLIWRSLHYINLTVWCCESSDDIPNPRR